MDGYAIYLCVSYHVYCFGLLHLNSQRVSYHLFCAEQEIDLFGYPGPIYEDDVLKIISNNMTIPVIVETFPIENQIPGMLKTEELLTLAQWGNAAVLTST